MDAKGKDDPVQVDALPILEHLRFAVVSLRADPGGEHVAQLELRAILFPGTGSLAVSGDSALVVDDGARQHAPEVVARCLWLLLRL